MMNEIPIKERRIAELCRVIVSRMLHCPSRRFVIVSHNVEDTTSFDGVRPYDGYNDYVSLVYIIGQPFRHDIFFSS